MPHDLVVVPADLGAAGALGEAELRAVGLEPVLTERGGVDAVVPRRLVELDERVRVEPVTAGSMTTLDDHDVGVAVFEQGVDERHPHRAGTDDEMVRLERSITDHSCTVARPSRSQEARRELRSGGGFPSPGRRRGWRLRRVAVCEGLAGSAGRGGADRSARLPPVHAVAVPGRELPLESLGDRRAAPQGVPQRRQRSLSRRRRSPGATWRRKRWCSPTGPCSSTTISSWPPAASRTSTATRRSSGVRSG